MKLWYRSIVPIILTSATIVSSCSQKKQSGIPVGQFYALSGRDASLGQSANKGAQLALEAINRSGGFRGQKIRLITEDNESKPGETSTEVHKLVTHDKVVALIGECSSGRCLEAGPIAQRSGIPMIAPSATNEKVTQIGDHIFRTCFIDSFQGEVCAKFLYQDLRARKVAIMTDVANDYSIGLAKSFKKEFLKEGGVITNAQSYSRGDKDFSSQLTAIKEGNPDAIFLPGYYAEVPLIIRQARQLGITIPFIGGDAWDSSDLFSVGGNAIEGCYISSFFSNQSTEPKVLSFVDAYRKKYHEDPDAYAALGYDSMRLLFDAMKRAGTTDPSKVTYQLARTKNFSAVTGDFTMDEHRNPKKPAVILVVKHGKFTYLKSIAP